MAGITVRVSASETVALRIVWVVLIIWLILR
jgi:hypothetical protein